MYFRCAFHTDIIELSVRWYFSYRLNYRDLVAMMAERGEEVSDTTILRWVVRYVLKFEKRCSRSDATVHPVAGFEPAQVDFSQFFPNIDGVWHSQVID
jgi:transposase-like protein